MHPPEGVDVKEVGDGQGQEDKADLGAEQLDRRGLRLHAAAKPQCQQQATDVQQIVLLS